jgi:tripartite-type tricarboxylate transporter receptor subunit TctC
VRWVVGYPAAAAPTSWRVSSEQYLSEKLRQHSIVENKPGAGNNIATEAVINAPPDGYTLLFVNPAIMASTPRCIELSFNFVRDIAPVASAPRAFPM